MHSGTVMARMHLSQNPAVVSCLHWLWWECDFYLLQLRFRVQSRTGPSPKAVVTVHLDARKHQI